ncbi:Uncharacterized protein Adt_25736 [Abeliophyllum distichum]|uniref:Uncharacterized protein n=1 Tax=Abeliophyllum distichum TaxID=126358 RepID=A0ABD1SHP1_9LAMI
MPDLPKAANKDGLKDKKEHGMGDSTEELPKSSFGRSKFERSKKDENEDDPGNPLLFNLKKVRVPRFEKYGSPPRILSSPTDWVTGEEVQEESDREIQKAKEKCEILHVNLVQEVDSKEDNQEVEIETIEKVIFRRPTVKLTKHLRPLYVKALVNGIPVAKVLIDNGAAINTILSRMIKKFTKTESDMIPTEVILTSFNGGATSAKGVMPLDITVGTITKTTVFFVIDGPTSYNVLLGRDWIHGNRCIPSSLHQCLVFWNDKGEAEVVQTNHRPFVAKVNSVERFMYEGNYDLLE